MKPTHDIVMALLEHNTIEPDEELSTISDFVYGACYMSDEEATRYFTDKHPNYTVIALSRV